MAGVAGIAHGAYTLSPESLSAGYTLLGLLGASYFTTRSAILSTSGARVERLPDRRSVLEGTEVSITLRLWGSLAARAAIEELVGETPLRVEASRRGGRLEAIYRVRVPYGRLRITGPRVTLTDPIGAFEASITLSHTTVLLGLPRVEAGVAARLAASIALQAGGLSGRPGLGLAYLYSREYMPDDDARLIDWKGYARRGKPLVKVFEVERYSTMLVVLDYTGGGREEAARAARLLATLGYTGVALGARVRAVTISDSLYTSPWVEKRAQLPLLQATLAQVEEGRSLNCEKHVELLERAVLSAPHPPATIIVASKPCSRSYERVLEEAATRSRVVLVKGGGVEIEPRRVRVVDAPGFTLRAEVLGSLLPPTP